VYQLYKFYKIKTILKFEEFIETILLKGRLGGNFKTNGKNLESVAKIFFSLIESSCKT
jgi:hypothetical protein